MIALGSHITYTHQAAVARRHSTGWGENKRWGEWRFVEPKISSPHTSFRGETLTVMTHVTPITFVDAEEMVTLEDRKSRYPASEERWERRNKTIFQWPEEGSGVVIGQVRRQFGISHHSTGEDDIGYFETFGQISLYVVKAELRGPEVYVPEASVILAHS